MISTREKFFQILFMLAADNEIREKVFKEYHIFYSSIKDCLTLTSGEDLDTMIKWMVDENESVINFVHSELLSSCIF